MLDKDVDDGSTMKPLNQTASVSNTRTESKKLDSKGINKCYVYILTLCIVMGSVQFGLVLGAWGILQNIYCAKQGWNIEDYDPLNPDDAG